ncbi:hypothetical protein JYU17_00530 [Flavobacteriaceae bacterium AH-315-O20]|nr:hypothetical protein [Flavobacteriaceae bacterium AH-315-O20]
MGISDYYMGIGLKRNISHFANMVKIAKSDNIITPEEMELLVKISKKYNIGEEKFKEIFKDPDKIPTIAHLECEERLERLYDLIKMVEVDHKKENAKEVTVLKKIVTGLAFPIANVDAIVACAIKIDVDNCPLEDFKKQVMEVNKI